MYGLGILAEASNAAAEATGAVAAETGIGWTGWDWFTLGLFFAGMCLVVWWVIRQKEETHTDYFLAGRNAGWLAIGASIFASNIGSEHLVGLAGAGANSGMAMSHWEIQAWLILVLGWFFVPFYARSKVFTMPEFLERRYCSGARSFLSVISLIGYVLTKVAVTVYAGGLVFKTVLGIESINLFGREIDFFWVGAISLVVITGIYTIIGGMKAVLYTSVLQTPVLLIGSIVILVMGLYKVADVYGVDGLWQGWLQVKESAGDNIRAIRPAFGEDADKQFPWTGVLLGSAIIGFWYWCTDQYIVQRVLSAADQKQARRGTIFGAYLKLTPVFIFLIPGMIAYALHQKGVFNLANPDGSINGDAAFPTLVRELLPIGVKGIVVGGLVAALMSSLASLFNSSAMLFTVDFYKKYRPKASEKELVLTGRIATGVVVVLGIVWIPVMMKLSGVLYEYLQDVQSLIAPSIAAVFIMGVFTKKATPAGGLWGLVIGFVAGMFRLVIKIITNLVIAPKDIPQSGIADWIALKAKDPGDLTFFQTFCVKFMDVNWLHYCIFLLFLSLGVVWLISLFTKAPKPEQLQGLTYGSASKEQIEETRNSWDKWDVINSVIIISIVLAFYAYFW